MVYIYSNLNSHLYMDGDLFTYSFLYVFSLIVFAIPKQIIFFQQEAIHGAIGGFTTAFTTHVKNNDKANLAKAPEKRSKARAASKVSGPAAMRLADAFKNSLGDLLPVPVPDANMELSYFGVQAGSVTASTEKGWSGSLRLATSGTKTILCLAASTMHGFAGNVNPATYWDTLLNVDKTSYEADLVKALYAGTLGPLDALFLPCGWLFAESVMGDGDLCGFAFRGVSSRNNESYNELQLVRKLLHAHNRSDSELEAAVNHLQTVLPTHIISSQSLRSQCRMQGSVEMPFLLLRLTRRKWRPRRRLLTQLQRILRRNLRICLWWPPSSKRSRKMTAKLAKARVATAPPERRAACILHECFFHPSPHGMWVGLWRLAGVFFELCHSISLPVPASVILTW